MCKKIKSFGFSSVLEADLQVCMLITLKMADQERSDFCVGFTMNLCTLETNVKFAISNQLDVHALKSYLRLICEYELYI